MTAKTTQVPALRFPEFEGAWQKLLLSQVLSKVANPVNVKADFEYCEIGIRSHGKGLFHKAPIYGEGLGDKRVFWVVPNALVLNIVFAWEQAVAVTTEKEVGMIASHRFPMFQPKQEKSDVQFLKYHFLTKKGKTLLELASPGGAGRNKTLGQKEFENLKLIIPSQAEQQKIASFLTAVDEKLQQLTRKKALLEQYKKGVMQKIFSQEIRFKPDDGGEYPEWEEKMLGEIVSFKYGKDQKLITDFDGKNPILGTGGVMGYSNEYLYDKPSVLIGRKGTIDRPVFMDRPFWTVDTLFYTEVKPECHPKWIFYLFQTINWYLYNEASGVPSLSASTISKISVEIPVFSEQQKIAAFLSAIDEKINQVTTQLQQAQQWKKGLLQGMFV